jgi:hypothetical protein
MTDYSAAARPAAWPHPFDADAYGLRWADPADDYTSPEGGGLTWAGVPSAIVGSPVIAIGPTAARWVRDQVCDEA